MEEDSDLLHPSPFPLALLQRNGPEDFLYSSSPTVVPCSVPPGCNAEAGRPGVCRLGEEGRKSIAILG